MNGMVDREKVIKGLECCVQDGHCYYLEKCPYRNDGCRLALNTDALALLKAQEYPNLDKSGLNPDHYVRVGDVLDCLSEIPMNSDMLIHVEGLITWAIGKRSASKDELWESWERDFEERELLDD